MAKYGKASNRPDDDGPKDDVMPPMDDPMMGGAPDIGDPMMELTAVPSVDEDMDG